MKAYRLELGIDNFLHLVQQGERLEGRSERGASKRKEEFLLLVNGHGLRFDSVGLEISLGESFFQGCGQIVRRILIGLLAIVLPPLEPLIKRNSV